MLNKVRIRKNLQTRARVEITESVTVYNLLDASFPDEVVSQSCVINIARAERGRESLQAEH